ncbi:MAG: endonuclease/exonuclease/phosphatase family protein [Planctomycetes bacterium]|nr:endonuclease/exonuclease/phosphatase family protein [Planctomycetota bacterium]
MTDVSFRIMSYNIHQGLGSELMPAYGLEKVAQAIHQHRPDIVGLQEVYRHGRKPVIEDMGARLAERMSILRGETWYLVWVPSEDMCYQTGLPKNARGYGDAIISRFPVLSTTHLSYNWGGKDRWRERRVCIQATLDVDGHHINVFNTHPARTDVAVQAPQIVDFMRMFPEPRIITGDFNLYEDNPWFPETHAVFTTQGYRDAWQQRGIGDGSTFPAGVADAAKRKHRIDYIFHVDFPGLVLTRVQVDQGEASSDHCPLIADYTWSGDPPAGAAQTPGAGTIARETWTGLGREATIAALLAETADLSAPPTSIERLLLFQAPWRVGERYGSRIRGMVIPPIDGDYVFWIAGHGNCELRLGEDERSARGAPPIARVCAGTASYVGRDDLPITDSGHTGSAQWAKYPSQRSPPIQLRAGRRYHIEAWHKDGIDDESDTLGDSLAVGWQLPDGTCERPIPGCRLAPPADAADAPIIDPALVVDAGPDVTVAGAVVLAGSARTPSGAAARGRISWIMASGPGTVRFWEPTSPTTLATFSAPGTYVLVLSVENHAVCAYDHVRIEVQAPC